MTLRRVTDTRRVRGHHRPDESVSPATLGIACFQRKRLSPSITRREPGSRRSRTGRRPGVGVVGEKTIEAHPARLILPTASSNSSFRSTWASMPWSPTYSFTMDWLGMCGKPACRALRPAQWRLGGRSSTSDALDRDRSNQSNRNPYCWVRLARARVQLRLSMSARRRDCSSGVRNPRW